MARGGNLWLESLILRTLLDDPDASAAVVHGRVLDQVAAWVERWRREHRAESLPAEVERAYGAWQTGGLSLRRVQQLVRHMRPLARAWRVWREQHHVRALPRRGTCDGAGRALSAVRRQRVVFGTLVRDVRRALPDYVPASVRPLNGAVRGGARWAG